MRNRTYLVISPIIVTLGAITVFSLYNRDADLNVIHKPPKLETTTQSESQEKTTAKPGFEMVDHGDHSHEVPISEPSEDTTSKQSINKDKYDWRNDTQIDDSELKVLETTDDVQENQTDDETYPPKNWYQTKDREKFYVYYHAQLIKQFGDIEEVRIVVDTEYKIEKGIKLKLDEQIQFLESQNHLWPDKRTQETLDKLIRIQEEHSKTNGNSHDHTH